MRTLLTSLAVMVTILMSGCGKWYSFSDSVQVSGERAELTIHVKQKYLSLSKENGMKNVWKDAELLDYAKKAAYKVAKRYPNVSTIKVISRTTVTGIKDNYGNKQAVLSQSEQSGLSKTRLMFGAT